MKGGGTEFKIDSGFMKRRGRDLGWLVKLILRRKRMRKRGVLGELEKKRRPQWDQVQSQNWVELGD